MRVGLSIFGREVVAVEVVAGYEEDGDSLDYELSSDTERADLAAWRDAHDEDAEPPPVIVAGHYRAPRRQRPQIVRLGTKHQTGDGPTSRVDVKTSRAATGFGFTPTRR